MKPTLHGCELHRRRLSACHLQGPTRLKRQWKMRSSSPSIAQVIRSRLFCRLWHLMCGIRRPTPDHWLPNDLDDRRSFSESPLEDHCDRILGNPEGLKMLHLEPEAPLVWYEHSFQFLLLHLHYWAIPPVRSATPQLSYRAAECHLATSISVSSLRRYPGHLRVHGRQIDQQVEEAIPSDCYRLWARRRKKIEEPNRVVRRKFDPTCHDRQIEILLREDLRESPNRSALSLPNPLVSNPWI